MGFRCGFQPAQEKEESEERRKEDNIKKEGRVFPAFCPNYNIKNWVFAVVFSPLKQISNEKKKIRSKQAKQRFFSQPFDLQSTKTRKKKTRRSKATNIISTSFSPLRNALGKLIYLFANQEVHQPSKKQQHRSYT